MPPASAASPHHRLPCAAPSHRSTMRRFPKMQGDGLMRVLRTGFICVIAFTALNGMQAAGDTKQPELTALKANFVPGEKTLFFDDFTDMTAGDAPSHFKVRGPAPELRAGGDIRQLTAMQSGSLYPNLTKLPKDFTYEAEVSFENARNARTALILY